MYRRNISSVLVTLGILLGLFVLYHSWLKPQFLPSSTPTGTSLSKPAVKESSPQPEDFAPQAILPQAPAEERRQERIIPAGEPPANPLADSLRDIHEELEKHNLGAVHEKLQKIRPEALAKPDVKKYVASLWNNLGLEQERVSGTSSAIGSYKRAVELDPTNPVAMLNLAQAYWERRDPQLTQAFLAKIISLAPNEAFPHLAMADLLQEEDKLVEAARHLEMATERAKKDPNLRSYLQAVTAKIKRTAKVEEQFTTQATTHFTVKYDGAEDQTTWMAVLDILEDAYREIGQKFDYFPSKPIIVVLHTKDSFQGATGSPAWADGLFDPSLGRIQIPTQGALTDRNWLSRVLRHEFVHALLHQRLGPEVGALPQWLNEGLAMQLAGDPWPDIDQVLAGSNVGEVKLIPLSNLEGNWSRFPGNLAMVAYLEGNSATSYMIDRFGMQKVREVLGALNSRQPVAAAFQQQIYIPFDQFQRQWIDTLNEKLSTPRG